jgi:uncharacterized protein (UPF0333 family)
MRTNKGQAAMEFLMTYGWAILIVVIAVAALAAFGVFNPGQFAQERCQGSATGFACSGLAAYSLTPDNQIRFELTNGASEVINITSITAEADKSCGAIILSEINVNGTYIGLTDDHEISPAQRFLVAIDCTKELQQNRVFQDKFTFTYNVVRDDGTGVTGLRSTVDVVAKLN